MSQAVSRALAIVDMCEVRPRTINELAAALDVHPTTALRLVQTLVKSHYLRLESGTYHLGPRLAELGAVVLAGLDLRSIAAPVLARLSALTGETVHLAERVGPTVIYVDKVESIHPLRMYSQIGRSAPLHCTGVGKAILAGSPDLLEAVRNGKVELPRFTDRTLTTVDDLLADAAATRERGYSEDDEEHEATINCIAAPIRGARGTVIGAVSIAAPVHRLSLADLREFAPYLTESAGELSRAMGMPRPTVLEAGPATV